MEERVEIEATHAEWARAIGDGDVDRVVGLLTADYELWAPGAEPVRGREAVRAMIGAALAAYVITPSYRSAECLVSGDLAIERGWDTQTVVPRAGGETVTRSQRVFLVMRRGDDGRWRYARGMSQPGPAGS